MNIKRNLSLIEVLISIVIMSVVFIPLSIGLTSGAKSTSIISRRAKAVWLATEKLEEIHYLKKKNGYWNLKQTYTSPVSENINDLVRTTTLTPYSLTSGIEVKITTNSVTDKNILGSDIIMKTIIGDY